MQNIMPTIVFFQDLTEGTWIMQNIGPGSAKEIRFAELDANNHVTHHISLNPVVRNEKVLFGKAEFKHCIRLVAAYTDVTGRRYYAICQSSKSTNPKRHPFPAMDASSPIPETRFSDYIKRVPV